MPFIFMIIFKINNTKEKFKQPNSIYQSLRDKYRKIKLNLTEIGSATLFKNA
mgnify:CR=1 FL=1